MPDDGALLVRYIWRGETLRNGRVLEVASSADASTVSGATLLEALASEEANVTLTEVVPYFMSERAEGWMRLRPHSIVTIRVDTAGTRRVDLMVEQPARKISLAQQAAESGDAAAKDFSRLALGAAASPLLDAETLLDAATARSDGFFGVGVYNSKHVENVGTLWRSAYMLGAGYIFTIGTRNAWEKAADTYKAWRSVPAFRYDDWAAFCASAPFSTQWVAVEEGGVPLSEFEHPERAIYLLGAEDAGLPASVVRACHCCVSLDAVRACSYNVSVAGSLVLYDRLQKMGRLKQPQQQQPQQQQSLGHASKDAVSSQVAPPSDEDVDYDGEGDILRSFFVGSYRTQLQSAFEAANAVAKLEAAHANFGPWMTAPPGQIGSAIHSAVKALDAPQLRPTTIKRRLDTGANAACFELLTLLEHEAFDME